MKNLPKIICVKCQHYKGLKRTDNPIKFKVLCSAGLELEQLIVLEKMDCGLFRKKGNYIDLLNNKFR